MNYYATFRTSYFKPTDKDALAVWLRRFGGDVQLVDKRDESGLIALMSSESGNGIPSEWMVGEGDDTDYEEVDFLLALSDFVDPDWYVEVQQVGNEGLRYLTAEAVLLGSDGFVDSMYFDQFTNMSQKLAESDGKSLTSCQY